MGNFSSSLNGRLFEEKEKNKILQQKIVELENLLKKLGHKREKKMSEDLEEEKPKSKFL